MRRPVRIALSTAALALASCTPDASGDQTGSVTIAVDPEPLYTVGRADGDGPDVLAVASIPNPQATPQIDGVSRTAEGGFQMTRRLHASFVPAARLAPLPDGRVAVAAETGYRVRIIGPEGAVEDVRSRPIGARAVSAADRSIERERRGAAMREAFGSDAGSFAPAAMSDEQIDDALEQMIFPDSLPVIRGLRSAPDGTLLVLRTDARSPDPGPLDVFDAGGTYRGTLRDLALPDALGPRGLAAWVSRDELDVQRVRVARLDFPWD